MKRLISILLCLALCFSLCACAPGGFLNSKGGGIEVKLPEKADNSPTFTEEQKLILGEWSLISITQNEQVTTYTDSFYNFTDSGKLLVIVNGITEEGVFAFTDGTLYLWGKPASYTIADNTLTITDADNKVHLLTKVLEETPEPAPQQ